MDNFDSFDIDDKLLFIKTAGLTLIDKTSIATISHIRLHSTYQLFRDLCEKLQEVSKELDTRETLELMESFNEELSKIVQNFGRDHKRTEFVDQFRGILEL